MRKSWKKWAVTGAMMGASGCFTSCVARGARVRTPNGTTAIEHLRIGDVVLSFDPLTGRSVEGRLSLIRSAKRETMLLRLTDRQLRLTTDHPVYCPDEGVYAPAGDWAVGRRQRLWCLTDSSHSVAQVVGTLVDGSVHEVFDLTVETDLHNFVADGVLVHNKSPVDQCEYQGVTTYAYNTCTCASGGMGTITCEGSVGICDGCLADAGPGPVQLDASGLDASPLDSGTMDAGPGDAAVDGAVLDGAVLDGAAPDGALDDAGATDEDVGGADAADAATGDAGASSDGGA